MAVLNYAVLLWNETCIVYILDVSIHLAIILQVVSPWALNLLYCNLRTLVFVSFLLVSICTFFFDPRSGNGPFSKKAGFFFFNHKGCLQSTICRFQSFPAVSLESACSLTNPRLGIARFLLKCGWCMLSHR